MNDMGMICFTICLFISPDLDRHRAYIDPAMFHNMFVRTLICFTIRLFISPDLDGYIGHPRGINPTRLHKVTERTQLTLFDTCAIH